MGANCFLGKDGELLTTLGIGDKMDLSQIVAAEGDCPAWQAACFYARIFPLMRLIGWEVWEGNGWIQRRSAFSSPSFSSSFVYSLPSSPSLLYLFFLVSPSLSPLPVPLPNPPLPLFSVSVSPPSHSSSSRAAEGCKGALVSPEVFSESSLFSTVGRRKNI